MATKNKIEKWSKKHDVCNEFCVEYKRKNPEAKIKVGKIDEGDIHCYIYDPTEDETLDPTLEQFKNHNPSKYKNDFWLGEKHPHVRETDEFDNITEFVKKFGGRNVLTDEERNELED